MEKIGQWQPNKVWNVSTFIGLYFLHTVYYLCVICYVLRLNSELFNRESVEQINHTTLPAYPEEIYMRDPNDFISTEVIVVGFNFL